MSAPLRLYNIPGGGTNPSDGGGMRLSPEIACSAYGRASRGPRYRRALGDHIDEEKSLGSLDSPTMKMAAVHLSSGIAEP